MGCVTLILPIPIQMYKKKKKNLSKKIDCAKLLLVRYKKWMLNEEFQMIQVSNYLQCF